MYEMLNKHGWATADSGGPTDLDLKLIITFNGKAQAERLLERGIEPSLVKPTPPQAGAIKATVAPASDRIVSLQHNSPEYKDIADGLASLVEQIRQENQVGESSGERDRILRSLTAARELWGATELRVIQVKVGVVMAVEDATDALTRLGKEVGKAGLIDLILNYAKKKIGIDL
ncbi:MAG: hypothetical protein WA957_00130 [Alteraurantiacibacter sp.]